MHAPPFAGHRANAIRPDGSPSVKARAVGVGTTLASPVGWLVGPVDAADGDALGPGPPRTRTPTRAIATTAAAAPRPMASGEILRGAGGRGGGGGGGGA